jgi:hypothetical protein
MAGKGAVRFGQAMAGLLVLSLAAAGTRAAGLDLGPQQIIYDGASVLCVGEYSVPSYVDWDNDGDKDLIVGSRETDDTGKVRLYTNIGSASSPAFNGFQFIQSGGADIDVGSSGCQGAFPRVADWNGDGRKDLLIGTSSPGNVRFYANVGQDDAPVFSGYTHLQSGSPKMDIDVGVRATLDVTDYDGDGVHDLAMGDGSGYLRWYPNAGTNQAPDLQDALYLSDSGGLIDVGDRASIDLADLDGDGCKDMLVGDAWSGKVRQYLNASDDPDAEPIWTTHTFLQSGGADIWLGFRTRPFACDWTGDGYADVLIGDHTGQVYLYEGVPEPASAVLLVAGFGLLARRRGR